MIIASNQSSAATTKPIPVAAKQWSQSIAIAAAISSVSYALGVLPWYLSQFPARLTSHGFSTRPRPAPLWSMAIIAFACGIAPQSVSFVPYVSKDVPFAAVAMLAAAAFAICLNDRRLTFATGAAIGALSTLPWFLRHEALIFTFVITLMACVVSLRWRPRPIGWMIGFLSALLLMVAFRSVLPKLVGSTPGSGGW